MAALSSSQLDIHLREADFHLPEEYIFLKKFNLCKFCIIQTFKIFLFMAKKFYDKTDKEPLVAA